MMSDHAAPSSGLSFGNATYDFIQRIVEILLPGAGALYFGASGIWGEAVFPNPDKVVGTIAILVVFLGLALRVSRKNYTPPETEPEVLGSFVINTTDVDRAPYRIEADLTLEELESKKTVTFDVKNSG
jgi:hypothetical protein